jgi:hypothetical protein
MYTPTSVSRLWAKTMHVTALAAATCAVFGLPSLARAAVSDCTAVQAAVALQSKTPFHAITTLTATKAGAFPTSTNEAIYLDNKMYTRLGNSPWLPAPTDAAHALAGVTGGNATFSECRRLPDDAIHGEATMVYAAKMESGEPARLWISTKSGLLLRDVVDEGAMKVAAEFDYANVRPPVK